MSALSILSVLGYSSLQDRGRPGLRHLGIPPGGALSPELLARANAAVDNPAGALAIEHAARLRLRAEGKVTLGDETGRTFELEAGDVASFEPPRETRVGVVAVRGGFDAPLLFGGRGTMVGLPVDARASRLLVAGDVLAIGGAARVASPSVPPIDTGRAVTVVPGPDVAEVGDAAVAALLATTFTASRRADRVGVRLGGRPLPVTHRAEAPSRPMGVGAIQVPPDGAPIVLGPDGPTTGGYPVVAVIASFDRGRFFAYPADKPVTFRAGS